MKANYRTAPELQVSQWFNTSAPIDLESLRGRVVMLHAFQMLCPSCITHGLPQAGKVYALFDETDVCVIGLHTVFEHHDVMTAAALTAFVHEYRLKFPIGIDMPNAAGPIPLSMQAFGLRGTPSVVLLDRQGRIRLSHFGLMEDMALGAAIGQLLAEGDRSATARAASGTTTTHGSEDGCDDSGCAVR